MPADIGGAIVMAGFVIAYSWIWKGARASARSRPEAAAPSASWNRATPMSSPATEPRRVNELDLKNDAIRACRAAAADYVDEHSGPVGRLLVKVRAWEAAPGPAEAQGWSVYRHLGLLRQVVNEPLLRDPEAAVLRAVTSVVEPVDCP
jgi:hypothetical protein